MDDLQFQFGQALKPEKGGLSAVKSALEKLYVLRVRGFDAGRMVACTLLFEGGADEVAAQERSVYRLASRHGGMKAGGANGERGYQLTFAIAYIRDFMLDHWVIAESFETSVAWSEALALCRNVKQRIWQEHAKRGLPGRPFISVRVTQLYDTGVCLYFYFAFHYKGVDAPSDVFAELERAARDEILRSGGSLSHHHGVGKLRQPFLPRVFSPAALAWRRRLKQAVDPENLLGAGNG
jgi:alkyldihydroxyacetonephosphate synthase